MTNVSVQIDLEQLAGSLAYDLREDDLVEFVKGLDEAVGMWTFTDALYKYFKKETKQARKDGWTND